MSEFVMSAERLGKTIEKELAGLMNRRGNLLDYYDLFFIEDDNSHMRMVMHYGKMEKEFTVPRSMGVEFRAVMEEIQAWITIAWFAKPRSHRMNYPAEYDKRPSDSSIAAKVDKDG